MIPSKVYIIAGSNLGNKKYNINQAAAYIDKIKIGTIILKSSFYVSQPWGYKSNYEFYNQIWYIETLFSPRQLLIQLQHIEKLLGRKKKDVPIYTDRTIDLDILFYDNLIIYSKEITIPHPAIAYRRFTLIPLCEIAHNYIHPVLNLTIEQLLQKCEDNSMVKKL